MRPRTATRSRWAILGAAAMLGVATTGSVASAGAGRRPVRLETARILFEVNATAQDAGIQMLLDGEGWEQLTVLAPDGGRLMAVRARGGIGDVGVTELFFESAEPSLADLPIDELLAMFPEGKYRIEGTTAEGRAMVGTATLSHDIADSPHVVAPPDGGVTDPADTVIDWDPVVEPAGIRIAGYQLIVELPEPLRVFSVDLPASVTSVTVSPEFLDPGTDYQFEVLAVAEGGNQTITEGTFTTGS